MNGFPLRLVMVDELRGQMWKAANSSFLTRQRHDRKMTRMAWGGQGSGCRQGEGDRRKSWGSVRGSVMQNSRVHIGDVQAEGQGKASTAGRNAMAPVTSRWQRNDGRQRKTHHSESWRSSSREQPPSAGRYLGRAPLSLKDSSAPLPVLLLPLVGILSAGIAQPATQTSVSCAVCF